jgi:hypothetical protein
LGHHKDTLLMSLSRGTASKRHREENTLEPV